MPRLGLGLHLGMGVRSAPVEDTGVFYVSSLGNDANSGRSPSSAWATMQAVTTYASTTGFESGDRVLFEGGQTFTGANGIEIVDHRLEAPLRFGSYGTGRATLQVTGDDNVILFFESNGIVEDLNIQGRLWSTSTKEAILFYSQGASDRAISGCRVSRCAITGGVNGLVFGTFNLDCHFEDVLVEDCNISAARNHAILSYAQNKYVHERITIRNCQTSAIHGGAGGESSGNHIVLGDCVDSLIENCDADGTTQTGAHDHNLIWLYNAKTSAIRDCTAGNASGAGTDRGAYGIDINSDDCVVERCYAYNCQGSGVLLMNGSRNIARFNLIVNCSKNYGSSIYVYGGGVASAVTANALDFKIYNNTIAMGVVATGTPYCCNVRRTGDRGQVINNIFHTTLDAARNVLMDNTPNANLRFYGNSYSRPSGALSLKGTTQYAGLTAWRGQGFEVLNSSNVGFEGNPLFDSEGLGLEAYRLQFESLLAGAGLGLGQFSLSATTDLLGEAVDPEDLSVGAIAAPAPGETMVTLFFDWSHPEHSLHILGV